MFDGLRLQIGYWTNTIVATMRKSLLFTFLFVFGCSSAPEPLPQPREITSPASPSSGQPNLATGPDGSVYLSWLETLDTGESALKIARRAPGGEWTAVGTVATGANWFVNYADFPSVFALADGTLAAHWSVEGDGIAINISISKDGGSTWSAPVVPHRDGTPTEHSMLTMMPAPGGSIGAVWLDGRKAGDPTAPSDEVQLIYTTIGLDGTLGPEEVLDARICECCQTAAIQTAAGLTIAYRDRSETEIREIALVRLNDGKWSAPQALSSDGWEIYACPINGPSISAAGSNVVAAWFAAPNDKAQINAALSTDGGLKFGAPILIAGGNSLGRVSAIALDNGDAIISWIETAEDAPDGAQVRLRRIKADGTAEEPVVVSLTSSSSSSGFPRMARSGSDIVIAWTDTELGGMVRTAVLTVP